MKNKPQKLLDTEKMFDICIRLMSDSETKDDVTFVQYYFNKYYPEMKERLNYVQEKQ